MIRLIYGGKGSGKTATMVQLANDSCSTAKGIIVFIDKSNALMHQLEHVVKLVDASEFGVSNCPQLVTFIKGMLAINYDIQTVFIDNIECIINQSVDKLQDMFAQLDNLADRMRVEFIISIHATKEQLPVYCSQYIE